MCWMCSLALLSTNTEYAQVLRMLGNGRLEAMCIDGVKRLCHIRGKMRKKVWVNTVCESGEGAVGRCVCVCAPATPCTPTHVHPPTHKQQGDIILVGLREYQDEKADVILKYMADEARNLKAYGELPEHSMFLSACVSVCFCLYVFVFGMYHPGQHVVQQDMIMQNTIRSCRTRYDHAQHDMII